MILILILKLKIKKKIKGFEIDESELKKYGTKYFTMDELKLKFFVLFDRGLKTALEIDNAKREK